MISLGPLVRREPTIEIEVIEEDEAIELEGLYPVWLAVFFIIFDQVQYKDQIQLDGYIDVGWFMTTFWSSFSETPVFTPFHVAVLSALLAVSALCVTLACFLCKKPRKQEM